MKYRKIKNRRAMTEDSKAKDMIMNIKEKERLIKTRNILIRVSKTNQRKRGQIRPLKYQTKFNIITMSVTNEIVNM